MHKGRLEAFSDGVVAILITIMVLELKVPDGHDWNALTQDHELLHVFLAYVLSFVFVGIYWNNHHHMLQATSHVNGRILWANMHLLFWLSLVPFTTGWLGREGEYPLPTALYGVDLLCCAIAYTILQNAIIKEIGPTSKLALAVKKDVKGKISLLLYLAAIPLAFWNVWIADGIYVTVALIWLAPDPRIERVIK